MPTDFSSKRPFRFSIHLDLTSFCNYNSIYLQGSVAVYEWDDEKNRENRDKHGLSFEDAALVFAGPCVTFDDDRFDYDEERFLTLGLLQGRVVLIAHTWRQERIRIISMRKASRREQEIYQKRLGKA